MNDRTKGLISVMTSAVFFGLMPLFARLVCSGGSNMFTVSFYRFFIALFPLFFYLGWKGVSISVSWKEWWRIALITVCGYGGTALLLYLSYDFIPSGMATTIHFVYPVFVILGSILFLREKPRLVNLLCVGLCAVGILLFYNGETGGSVLGLILAFCSGMTYAFYIIYLGASGLQNMPTLKLIFHMNAVGSVLLFVGGIASQKLSLGLTGSAWLVMIILAVGASFVGVCLFQRGVQILGSQNAAILSTLEPITSVATGALFFHEGLGIRSAIGCLLILISVVLVALAQGEPKTTTGNERNDQSQAG